MFWRMVDEMSDEDRVLLVKFWTGRNRLEIGSRLSFYIDTSADAENRMPEGHTCGYSMDIPQYTNYDKMVKLVTAAIRYSGEIDADGGGEAPPEEFRNMFIQG